MKIPKTFKVGKKRYVVYQPLAMAIPLSRGSVNYDTGIIKVATNSGRTLKALSGASRTQTFWHEVLHAALYDMGSRKHADEGFVNELAKRIAGVVESVRF